MICMQVFIACGIGKSDVQAEDPFRKPKTGMWQLMEQHLNSGIPIDMEQLIVSSVSFLLSVVNRFLYYPLEAYYSIYETVVDSF